MRKANYSMCTYHYGSIGQSLPILILALLVLVLAGGSIVIADDQAVELLGRAGQVLRDSRSLEVHVAIQNDFTQGDLVQIDRAEFNFVAEKPNRLSFRQSGNWSPLVVVSNGNQSYVYQGIFHQYFLGRTSSNFQRIFNDDNPLTDTFSMLLPTAKEILTGNFLSSAQQNGMEITSLPQRQFQGQTLLGVRLADDTTDWDLWFNQDTTMLAQVSVDYERYIESMRSRMPDMPRISMTQKWTFDNWRIDTTVNEQAFSIDPPVGADQVFSFGHQPPQHPLVGRDAMDFQLNFLDGTSEQLSKHIGTDAIILDFWAIRCPPCREGLPLLAEATEQYNDQGVVLYAVNSEDNPRAISDFLEDFNHKPTPVRDPGGRISSMYMVSGIPQTVLIGKDGIIQSVHVGFSPDIETQIDNELPMLAQGKTLVGAPPESRNAEIECLDVRLLPNTLQVDQRATASFTIANHGPDTLDPGMYVILLFIDQQDSLVLPGREALNPGEQLTINVPADQWACKMLAPGEHSLTGVIIGYGAIEETDSDNNTAQRTIQVLSGQRSGQ